jgi:hypothetical protein
MLNATMNGTATDRYVGFIQVAGNLYSDRIIIPGEANEGIVGHAREYQVINQLGRRFLLDRHIHMTANGPFSTRLRVLSAAEITADAVTVVEGDHGRTFINTGADATTTFTLPAAEIGLMFTFHAGVNQTMTLNRSGSTVFNSPGSISGTSLSITQGETVTVIGIAANVYMALNHEAATD